MTDFTRRDRAVVWHPFTQMKTASDPLTIVRGEGVYLFDEQGNSYIDAISSWWVNVHGHAHPHIHRRVCEQLRTLEHVIFAGFTHPWAIELSERVLAMQHFGHGKVFFSDNGSTAVEVGLKMALQYWWNQDIPRNRIIALEGAYHGDTVGAMSAGGRGAFTSPYEEMLFDVVHIPLPDGSNNKASKAAFQEAVRDGRAAAFIYEPAVQGAAGMRMCDIEGMNDLLYLAGEHDVIRIADEVMTGFGRTGKLFASAYFDTPPDIMCLSKALTGGTLPLSLTTCTDKIYDSFLSDDRNKTFFHGHSYTGNPTACAAALASLDLMDDPAYRDNMSRIHQRHTGFARELPEWSFVRNVRIRGTILAFEIDTGKADSYFHDIRDRLYDSFLAQGILLRPLGNTVYILPPMVISDEELDRVYGAIRKTLDQLRSGTL